MYFKQVLLVSDRNRYQSFGTSSRSHRVSSLGSVHIVFTLNPSMLVDQMFRFSLKVLKLNQGKDIRNIGIPHGILDCAKSQHIFCK